MNTIEQRLAEMGFTMSATFVPAPTAARDGINWIITITRGGKSLTTEYCYGIGRLPDYNKRHNDTHNIGVATKNGTWFKRPVPKPSIADVMHCLTMDSSAVDQCFEDWASNYGYGTDSRTAEQMYRKCVELGYQLRTLANISELQDFLLTTRG
jgi:hypothetical protein